jgi:hypothetical protein
MLGKTKLSKARIGMVSLSKPRHRLGKAKLRKPWLGIARLGWHGYAGLSRQVRLA